MAGKCPGRRNYMLVHDTCLLRHASASFFGAADTSRVKYRRNPQNATQPEQFASLLAPLMGSLAERAAYASPRMFAVGTADVTSSDRIYGMAQCTRDLGKDDCHSCLVTAVSRIPTCCAGRRGGQVIFRTCSVRFEVYPFFSTPSEAAMLRTPPPQPAGQIMDGNSKISLSNGLCVYKKASDACHLDGKCHCCDVTDLCYLTVALCKKYCEGSPH
ncbi:cysteine-rich repeat secretory protein 38-like isoform X2 [Triticum aestivum]|uniref:cysteine-rich repeat secretory protein 38-like isoform X1 n=1 Tax=Triticum aestivum TaxID=4565 RepID=UPI001D00E9F2|nr:cysteine-rich repeat secretory protein 38-like isoform X1 [Triticum aestivum]XP_044320901.1 cysteine-rich repeat secretory protein 38-like isoform X2 [Triticum aestivum]